MEKHYKCWKALFHFLINKNKRKGMVINMILEKIALKTKERIEELKQTIPLRELKSQVADLNCEPDFPFEKALQKDEISFICEVKKASPSKGVIAQSFPYVDIAKEYEKAGADAISILTEPYFFQGNNQYLSEIRNNVKIPLLRKDFTIDEYMIYEAKVLGADAILLICSILSQQQLTEYSYLAKTLGLSALVETHNEQEIAMALESKAKIIGVNNRNLKDFTVDINHSLELRKLVPDSVLFVSESGMSKQEDIKALCDNGTNGVLIGETLMRSNNKKEMLNYLAGKCP